MPVFILYGCNDSGSDSLQLVSIKRANNSVIKLERRFFLNKFYKHKANFPQNTCDLLWISAGEVLVPRNKAEESVNFPYKIVVTCNFNHSNQKLDNGSKKK